MAMSGGVDSSVSALVLRDEGYEVEGVTMKLFDNDDAFIEDEQTCCSTRDVEDARSSVAKPSSERASASEHEHGIWPNVYFAAVDMHRLGEHERSVCH